MAKRQSSRSPDQEELTFPAKRAGRSPEEMARLAAEYLSARAIRERRNVPAVIAKILAAA